MVPSLLFYQLLLVALVLICLMLHVGWPAPLSTTPQTPVRPDKPRPQAPGALPPVMIFTQGRRRIVDTQHQFCPDPDCSYHGWLGRGNIRSNEHPGGQPWRQLQCVSCHGYFYETHGTIFHGKRSSPQLIVRVIACLAESLGMRGTARVFEIDPNTVLSWLEEVNDGGFGMDPAML